MSKNDPIELDIPESVAAANHAVEVLSAWIADGALMVALNAGAFGDRVGDWGRLLAEIGHHVAKASELEGQMAHSEALEALTKGFMAHVGRGEASMSGKLVGRKSH